MPITVTPQDVRAFYGAATVTVTETNEGKTSKRSDQDLFNDVKRQINKNRKYAEAFARAYTGKGITVAQRTLFANQHVVSSVDDGVCFTDDTLQGVTWKIEQIAAKLVLKQNEIDRSLNTALKTYQKNSKNLIGKKRNGTFAVYKKGFLTFLKKLFGLVTFNELSDDIETYVTSDYFNQTFLEGSLKGNTDEGGEYVCL